MARLFYMSLTGVGDWSAAMRQSGAQLAPYHSYLGTAKRAADNRALSLAWRLPTDEERHIFEQRLRDSIAHAGRRIQDATRRRDRRTPASVPAGEWIVLENRPDRQEEPETTFEAFLDADVIHDRPAAARGANTIWLDSAAVEIRACDIEGLAILVSRLPSEVPPPDEDADDAAPGRGEQGPLLFLRPNTWPLECQRRVLSAIENSPVPRVAPLLRLVSTRPTWPLVVRSEINEDDWIFLRRGTDGQLRDGTTEQRDFVRRALGTPDFAVLEGPPGSGKTTSICELIAQLARSRKRVLLVASTHVAVDNVLEVLIKWQDKANEKIILPVRIGDEKNISSDAIGAWTLRNLLRTWNGELLDFLDRPIGATTDGAAARQMLQASLQRKGEESAFLRMLLDASNLVCGTTIGILQHPAIKAARKGAQLEPFDFLILDEASKTTFTEFLVPAVYARRWVVVGDRRQLSPYVEEQDLAENLQGLLPPEVGRAAASMFLASSALGPQKRVRSLIAVSSDDEARLLADEAEARGVAAVDLDGIETTGSNQSAAATCLPLLFADVVFGNPATIAALQHRLPGDLQSLEGPVPELPDWEAHRRALRTRPSREATTWGHQVAWRQVRAYELRYNEAEQGRLLKDLDELAPRMLGDWYFKNRRRRILRDGQEQTPAQALEEDLANFRRVSMPSILEILQLGAGSLGWDLETALTNGLPDSALAERMVSLSFQHRMHPEISAFPREQFYSDADLLHDARDMGEVREWAYSRYARRAIWLDISPRRDGQRGRRDSGNRNPAEAEAIVEELQAFVKWAATAPRPGSDPHAPWEVAVLTFYRGQEKELRFQLQELTGQRGNTRNFRLPDRNGRVHVTLCTVDRFQGHEADLVFLSFVMSGTTGFLNSPNRLNVAVTRARYQLVLVGHRSWMASSDCRSGLLRLLGTSERYARDIGWGRE
jgi:hypothetical protein